MLHGSAPAVRASRPQALAEDLSGSELRVLRYLPSNLSASEIAAELYLSTSTVKTHMRHIYDKLGAHRRTEAVDRARALGLLGPSGPGEAEERDSPRRNRGTLARVIRSGRRALIPPPKTVRDMDETTERSSRPGTRSGSEASSGTAS